MPEKDRDRFCDLHGFELVQYILSLNDLPLVDEFVSNYTKLSKARMWNKSHTKMKRATPCRRRRNGLKMYRYLERVGLL